MPIIKSRGSYKPKLKNFEIFRDAGHKESLATYSVVAGIWSCLYSLGEVIGPSLGGVLLQYYGFPVMSTVMAAIILGIVSF